MRSKHVLDKAIKILDKALDEDVIRVKRRNKYWVDVKLEKSNPYISAQISKALKRDKRVDGLLGSGMSWEVSIEGDDNESHVKNLLSGYGTIR